MDIRLHRKARGTLEATLNEYERARSDPRPQGGDSSIKMPECVCWGFENEPILKDALG